ncbi:uncharacterized protein G2W53_041256 [Senna tora]|uniref:Uncharacterized protein n=1 Tax=Senna tora TaxID=362788 RepID=A0A834VZ10_9FABA|nr:uncharacterized protein G2W53_041256 [Senna tora]
MAFSSVLVDPVVQTIDLEVENLSRTIVEDEIRERVDSLTLQRDSTDLMSILARDGWDISSMVGWISEVPKGGRLRRLLAYLKANTGSAAEQGVAILANELVHRESPSAIVKPPSSDPGRRSRKKWLRGLFMKMPRTSLTSLTAKAIQNVEEVKTFEEEGERSPEKDESSPAQESPAGKQIEESSSIQETPEGEDTPLES